MTDSKQLQITPVDRLKKQVNLISVQEQFDNALGENKNAFTASLIDLFVSEKRLQTCDPNLVIAEALKAATLKLPINKSLGFAYIIPYKNIPTFQIGYKGLVQLAIRSGIYSILNTDNVYEGELVSKDKLTGTIDLSGERTSDTIVGYFAHLETVNGFKKTVYGSVEEVKAHGSKFSKSYNHSSSVWKSDFDAMARKTMITQLLSKFGLMSVEMATQMEIVNSSEQADRIYENDGNTGDIIDINTGEVQEPETVETADSGVDVAINDEPPPNTQERPGPNF